MNNKQRSEKAAKEFYELLSSEGYTTDEVYAGANKKITLKCPKGHDWKTVPSSFKNAGCRCHHCGYTDPKKTKAIKRLDITLSEKGYKLTGNYTNNNTKTYFECSQGHELHCKPRVLTEALKKGKAGCSKCSKKCPKEAEGNFRSLLKKNGDTLISKYVSSSKKCTIKCSAGHLFEHKPNEYRSLGHCPKCTVLGLYSEVYFHNNPEMKDAYGEFYSFEFTQDGQKYLMVGITTYWVRRRWGYRHLEMTNVKVTPMKLYEAFKIEQEYLKENGHLRPTESLGFKGWTECIRIEE